MENKGMERLITAIFQQTFDDIARSELWLEAHPHDTTQRAAEKRLTIYEAKSFLKSQWAELLLNGELSDTLIRAGIAAKREKHAWAFKRNE